jgi:hypothetical protein
VGLNFAIQSLSPECLIIQKRQNLIASHVAVMPQILAMQSDQIHGAKTGSISS